MDLAWFAILLYPIGLIFIIGAALFVARHDIRAGAGTPFSRAIRFLYAEYCPSYFWWEIMEMFRRLVLVGILVLVDRGSVTQIVVAAVFSVGYFAIQMQAAPYEHLGANFLANTCSLAQVIFVRSLAAEPTRRTRMTPAADIAARLSLVRMLLRAQSGDAFGGASIAATHVI